MFCLHSGIIWSSCLMLTLLSAQAVRHPLATVPLLVAAAARSSKQPKAFLNKMLSDNDLPPIGVGLQVDFELSLKSPEPKASNPVKLAKVAPKVKAIPPKPAPELAPAVAIAKTVPPPPPPQRSSIDHVEAKNVAAPVPAAVSKNLIVKKSKPASTFSSRGVKEINSNHLALPRKNRSIGEHKYAKVVWAALLFVWVPLGIIFVVNKIFGKEFLIDILVKILPENFPATYIEMAIEDGLWLGVFGVSIVATVGTLLMEMTLLVIGVVKSLSQQDPRKSKREIVGR